MSNAAAARAALERFEDALVASGHPITEALRPGLDPHEIDQALVPLGLRLPDDAAELWRWHDGIEASFTANLDRVPGSELFPCEGLFRSLGKSIELYVHMRETFPFEDRDDWSRKWFPFTTRGNGDTIWLDCSGPATGPALMVLWYLSDYNEADDLKRRRISVVEGINVMAALVEREIWAVDPNSGIYNLLRDPDPDLNTAWLC